MMPMSSAMGGLMSGVQHRMIHNRKIACRKPVGRLSKVDLIKAIDRHPQEAPRA